jgi:hypothetical protein
MAHCRLTRLDRIDEVEFAHGRGHHEARVGDAPSEVDATVDTRRYGRFAFTDRRLSSTVHIGRARSTPRFVRVHQLSTQDVGVDVVITMARGAELSRQDTGSSAGASTAASRRIASGTAR